MRRVVQFAVTGLMLAGMFAGASTTFKAASGNSGMGPGTNWTPAPKPPGPLPGGDGVVAWTPAPKPPGPLPGGDGVVAWTPAPKPPGPLPGGDYVQAK